MTNTAPRIAVVGSTMIDLVVYAPRIPGAGETLVGDRFQMGFGGKGANQAVMARILGGEVAMVNCLGDDAYGTMTLDNFRAWGVDTTHVVTTTAAASGVAQIWVEPDGMNRIVIVPGANHHLPAAHAVAAVTSLAPGVVVGQFEIPQEVTTAAFTAARAAGALTILNPAPGAPTEPALLSVSDWVVPNEVELATLTGSGATDDAALAAASKQLGTRLLVTLGPAGCALARPDGSVRRVPAPRVTAVDTTGAGDAFVGSLAYALGAGLDDERAMRLANVVAADSVTRPGTHASFPDAEWCREVVAGL